VVRALAAPAPRAFRLFDVSERPFSITRPLVESHSDLGPCLIGEFSDIDRPGLYQIVAGGEHSVQFAIQDDVWRRTLAKAVGYYRYQRCGVEVPGVHPVCHLDDARRRDNGEHIDVVGGWHDAGDLRKWMDVTMLNGIALLNLLRNTPEPRPADPTHEQILEEVRHGNRYFLKMQDKDGKIWADAAGGVNGDNSDNRWTDNVVGTADDRYINTAKRSGTAAIFTALQGLAAQSYAHSDPPYAKQCLEAGIRAWNAFETPPDTTQALAWWAIAACELFRATSVAEYREHAMLLGRDLMQRQNTQFIGDQKQVRGFWMQGNVPYMSIPESAVPPLAGRLTYRYFHPVRKQFWWQGANCHLAANALVLGRLAKLTGDKGSPYTALAYRQLEWIMGANPFSACMMTGEGMRNPFPHSRFVGLIPGGIMNGIAGNVEDEPVLDMQYTLDWRTCEYWSPHVAYYIWANSVLEKIA